MSFHIIGMAFVLFCTYLCTSNTVRADDAIVSDILRQWKNRQSIPLRIKYTLTSVQDKKLTQPVAIQGREPSDKVRVFTTNPVVLLDMPSKRIRLEHQEYLPAFQDRDKWAKITRIFAWDGKTLFVRLPKEINDQNMIGNVDMVRLSGDLAGANTTLAGDDSLLPAYIGSGIIPTPDQIFAPNQWPVDHSVEAFDDRGDVSHLGRKVRLLRTEAIQAGGKTLTTDYWVDRYRNGAVVKIIDWAGKATPWYVFDIEHQNVQGHWLPKKWTFQWYNGKTVVETVQVTVDAVVLDPVVNDGDFIFVAEPGMRIRDQVFPDRKSGLNPFRPAEKKISVDNEGREITESISGFYTPDGTQVPARASWWKKWWVWSSVCIVIVGVLLWKNSRTRK